MHFTHVPAVLGREHDPPLAEMGPERRRLTYALLLSLLVHGALLSLTFGGQGIGLPAFGLPWKDRRVEAPDLRIALVPAPVAVAEPTLPPIVEPALAPVAEPTLAPVAPPLRQPSVERPVTKGPTIRPPVPRAAATVRLEPAAVPEAKPQAEASLQTEATPGTEADPQPEANPAQASSVPAATDKASPRSRRSRNRAPPPIPAPAVIALESTDEDTWVVPLPPAIPPMFAPALSAMSAETPMPSPPVARDTAAPRIEPVAPGTAVALSRLDVSQQGAQQAEQLAAALKEAARQAASLQQAARQRAARNAIAQEATQREAQREEVARQAAALQQASQQAAEQQEAALQEAARQATALQEAAGREAARQETARQEAARQEAARQEAARIEAARIEAVGIEAARIEAQRAEAGRQEAARQEAARAEAVRQEAARQEAARQEAARAEAARQEAAGKEAARLEAQEAEARREARLRAIGRQLDEEAARRDAIATAGPASSLPPPSWRPARRYRLFGRTDSNEDIIRYAEAWERKIQLNMTFDMIREAIKQPHVDPMVTVAIRSDGSVEKVTFVQSSGVPALDEAIRRIVDTLKPYQAFPPTLAGEYDVLEIRRTWQFDMAIRLY